MGLSLKKLWDQANVFDGGRSYQTQATNADRAKLANQQLNQARAQSLQKAASMGNVQSRNKLAANNFQIKYQAPPSFGQNIENATGTVGGGIFNVANSVTKAPQILGRGVGNTIATFSPDYKSAEESARKLTDIDTQVTGNMFKLARSGTPEQRQRAINYLNKSQPTSNGMNDLRTQIASENDPKRLAAAAGSLGFDLATLRVAGASKAGIKTAYQAGKASTGKVTTGLVQATKRFGVDTAKTASMGAVSGAAYPLIENPNATAKEMVQGAAMGAVAGAALPTAFVGAGYAKDAIKPTTNLVKSASRTFRDMGKPTGQALQNLKNAVAEVDAQIIDQLKLRSIAETRRPDLVPILDKRIAALESQSDSLKKKMNTRNQGGGYNTNPKYDDLAPKTEGVAPKSAPVSYAQPNIRAKDIEVGDNLEIRDYGTKINQYNKEPAKNTTGKVVKIERNKEGESIYGGKIRGAVTYIPEGQTTLVHLEMPNGEIKIVKASEMGRDIWLGKNMEKGFAPEKLPVVNKQTAALSEEAAKEIDNIKTTADMFQNGKLNETQKKRIAELQDQAESSALSPQEEIQRIHNMAYRRGDKYTLTEEKRLAELKDQINNSQPVVKTAPAPKPKVTVKKTVETPPPTKKPNVAQSNKPEVSFVERQAKAQADKEAQILKPRGVEAVRSKGRDVSSKLYNPYSEAERLNQLNAKSQGLSITGATKKLDASDDLASQMDFVANSRVAAKQLMEDTGLDKVIQKYPDKKGKVNEFVLYLAAKRDVAVSGAKGKRIYGGETLEDVNKFIADFEARKPQAKSDLEAVKGSFRKLLDDELAAGTITPEFHKNALATEDYYAPIERVLGSEDVLRPSINVNNKASLSRTSATRKLEGSADPVKGDWDAVIGGMQRRVRETKLNQAYGVMYDIAKNKRIDDAVQMGMSKEQSQALIGLQDTITALQKEAQAAKGAVKTASKKAKVESKKMTAYQNKVNDKAIERIAQNLEVNDVDGAATVRSLKRSDKNQLMSWLQGNMTDAEVTNGIKKSAQLQDAVARLQEARAIADDLQTTGTLFKGARSELIQATDARGRQVIRGFVDGYPTWLEVTPEIAKMVQGLEPQKLPGLIKGLSSLQRVWRTFWTGAYNPVFAVKSFLLYDPPMAAINQSGSRFQLDPRVAGKAIADVFTDYDGFFKELKRTGVQPVYGSKMSGDIKLDAKVIASHKNFQSRLAYLATHPGQLIEALDVVGGKLAHSTRMRTARAEYTKSISHGLSKKVALENAARAYNNVLPNYGRVSRLMKEIDAVIPYASAGVAGNRALTSAMRTDPIGWAAKASLFAIAIAATGEYALASDETKEFYQDMYDSNKVSVLQNNIVFALPGAKKDPETGEWSGIVKIAIPPEFRAPNALLQQALADNNQVDTGDYDPRLAAGTSMATAGITNIGRSGDINAEYNPAIQAGLELATNKQGGTGDSFAYGDNQYLPRNEQINDNTSQLAISGAQTWNKLPLGDISPAALDAQFKSLGMGGNIIRSVGSSLTKNENTTDEQLPSTGIDKAIKGLYSADGTKGMTETGWHFKHQDQVMNTLPSKVLRDQFSIVNSKNDSPGDAQAKSQLLYESLQSDGTLWDAQKKQNDLDATKTGISNPLFGLTPEQARAVTLYRGNARMTAAKQTYAKDGSSLFESLGLDEKWYQDFKKQEDAFYKKLESKKKDSNSESVATTAKTYSGNPYQEPSRVIQSKLDVYYTLPKGTGARTAFLKSNPDVVQYWDQQNGLANEERLAMGLDLLGTEGDKYSGYGSGGGGGGGGSSTASLNALKYALPLSAGGKFKSPVASKGKAVKVGVKRKDTTAKPKVSIKKSLV